MPTSVKHPFGGHPWFVASRLCSTAATSVCLVIFPLLTYSMTGSPLWSAIVVGVQGLPYLLLGIPLGRLADRRNRQRLIIGSEVVCAVSTASVPVVHLAGHLSLLHVLVVAVITRTTFVLTDAAAAGAIPAVVGPALLARVQALLFAAAGVIEVVVPMIAGLLFQLVSPAAVLTGASLMSATAAVLVGFVSRPFSNQDPATTARTSRFREPWVWLWQTSTVRALTLIAVIQTAGQGFLLGQLAPWAHQNLDVAAGSWQVGALFAGWAFGGLLGSALVIKTRQSSTRNLALGLTGALVAAAGAGSCAVATSWVAGLAAVALWGGGFTLSVVVAVVERQRLAADHQRSQIHTAARILGFGVGFPLGGLLGALGTANADRYADTGPAITMVVMAGLLVVAAVVAGWWSRPSSGYVSQPRCCSADQ